MLQCSQRQSEALQDLSQPQFSLCSATFLTLAAFRPSWLEMKPEKRGSKPVLWARKEQMKWRENN